MRRGPRRGRRLPGRVLGRRTDLDPRTTNGCPRGDRDNDLVFDDEDACPDVPGVPHRRRALTNGCPTPRNRVSVEGHMIMLGDIIHFDVDSPRVRSVSWPVVKNVADFPQRQSRHHRDRHRGARGRDRPRRLQHGPLQRARRGRHADAGQVRRRHRAPHDPRLRREPPTGDRARRESRFARTAASSSSSCARACRPSCSPPTPYRVIQVSLEHWRSSMSRRQPVSSVSFLRLAATFAASTGALSTSLVGCGASGALVGGECAPGCWLALVSATTSAST